MADILAGFRKKKPVPGSITLSSRPATEEELSGGVWLDSPEAEAMREEAKRIVALPPQPGDKYDSQGNPLAPKKPSADALAKALEFEVREPARGGMDDALASAAGWGRVSAAKEPSLGDRISEVAAWKKPSVEVDIGEPEIISRTPRQPEVAVRTTRETGAAARAPSAPSAPRQAPSADAFASVRAQSPEVAEYLQRTAGQQETPLDGELSAAQGQARDGRLLAQLGRAGAMFNEAVSGARYDRGAYDDLEAGAERPVAELQARRAADAQRAEEGRRSAREGREVTTHTRSEDLYRPDSERSANARSMALLRFPEKVAGIPYEKFQRMSAADVAELVQGLGADRDDEARAASQKADLDFRGKELAGREEDRRLARQTHADSEKWRRDEREEARTMKETAVKDRQAEKDRQELQKRLGAMGEVDEDVRTVNRFIEQGGDIPGVGVFDSWMMQGQSLPAKAARAMLADRDDIDMAGAIGRLTGNENRAMTGLASSDSEREENKRRRGLDAGSKEEAAVRGLQTLARDAKSKAASVEAGFRERAGSTGVDVVDEFAAAGGKTSRDVPEPAQRPTGRIRTNKRTGEVQAEMEDGSWRTVKNGR